MIAARIEFGLRAFLAEGGFGAFTDTFGDLHGMSFQTPSEKSFRAPAKFPTISEIVHRQDHDVTQAARDEERGLRRPLRLVDRCVRLNSDLNACPIPAT